MPVAKSAYAANGWKWLGLLSDTFLCFVGIVHFAAHVCGRRRRSGMQTLDYIALKKRIRSITN